MVPSTVVSFPDEVEVEEAMSPTESDSRTPVSSSDHNSASSDFFFFRCRPTPTLEVVATRSDSAPGKSSSRRLHFILLRLVFISSFSGPRSSGVLRRLVRLLRLRLDPYVSWLLPFVFHWFSFILFLWSSWFFFLFCLDLCLFRTSAAVVFPTWTRLCQGRLSSIPATRRLPR